MPAVTASLLLMIAAASEGLTAPSSAVDAQDLALNRLSTDLRGHRASLEEVAAVREELATGRPFADVYRARLEKWLTPDFFVALQERRLIHPAWGRGEQLAPRLFLMLASYDGGDGPILYLTFRDPGMRRDVTEPPGPPCGAVDV